VNKPWQILESSDPQVFHHIEAELGRQCHGIELIASENFASPAVIAAMGNVLTNKYAEGRPGKRYYGGCEEVDKLENLAIERACALYGCNFANVQPHSGAQANAAMLLALAQPGDAILGMELSHGGHLTHGSPVNFSGVYYKPHFYGLHPTSNLLDYEEMAHKARRIRPKVIIAGASAYSRYIDFRRFRAIADEVGAYLMVDMAHIAGLVAAGVHPSPIPHAHVVTSTTHKTLRGPRGGLVLWNDEALSVNLNKGVFPGIQGGPLEHIIAAKAVCFREAALPSFVSYQQQVLANSKACAAALLQRGFHLVSGGSDNHLLLIDLSQSPLPEISGKVFEEALGQAGITVNKNTVPGEKRSPFVTSGLRIGTPAMTSRGMKEDAMEEIIALMHQVYTHSDDASVLAAVRKQVEALAGRYPLYPQWMPR
jgi:glycine hydroxymethyltransferase